MSRPTDKHTRLLLARKILARRAVKCGWGSDIEALPRRTRLALSTTGNIRLGRKGDDVRKGFSLHGSGYTRRSNYTVPVQAVASRHGIAEYVNAREARQEGV